MSWEVHIPKRVSKVLMKFPVKDRSRMVETMREFQDDPWQGDIVKLKDEKSSWRRRVGNYRIFYSTNIDTKVVEIKEIERRTSKTY